MASVYTLSEDIPNERLSLRHEGEHLTFDQNAGKLLVEQRSFFGLRKKILEVPFSQVEEITLEGKHKEGEEKKEIPLKLRVKYRDQTGALNTQKISLQVKDINHRAELMDLLFRMGRSMTTVSPEGAFRGGETLPLDRYVVQQCTDEALSLSLVRSTTPEGVQGRPVPEVQEPADYLSDEARRRIDVPLPTLNPKRFLGLYRFLSWLPGKKIELLGMPQRGPIRELLHRIAKIAFPTLLVLAPLLEALFGRLHSALNALFAVGINISGIYLLVSWLFRWMAWNPEKPLVRLSVKYAGWLIALYLLSSVGTTLRHTAPGIAALFVVLGSLSFLFGATGLAARHSLNPEKAIPKGAKYVLLDWEKDELKTGSARSFLSRIQEIVCSLHQEEKDGKTHYFSRLEAVLPDRTIQLAESERFVKTRLEPYFVLAPMGEEISKALHVPMRSEDKTTPQAQPAQQEVAQEVAVVRR